ncbi:uncharacterized protein CXorf51A-like [Loxodonta africana]|uniref:uncharacterized protein CXorf51A-like n=1 Tax=Loxodonta africana TaxID=9785 RepID=UPI0030CC5F22
MARTPGKPQASAAVTEQPAPSPKGRKKGKAPAQPRSSGSVKVPKTTAGVKRSPQGSLRKKAPLKTSARPRVPKKARGPTLFGHYHKFNKKLNLKEPSEDQESLEKATTSSNDQSSQ